MNHPLRGRYEGMSSIGGMSAPGPRACGCLDLKVHNLLKQNNARLLEGTFITRSVKFSLLFSDTKAFGGFFVMLELGFLFLLLKIYGLK